MAINWIGAGNRNLVVVDLVGDDLVSLDVPVGPAFGGASAAEAEDVTVEPPCGLDVMDWQCQVKGGSVFVICAL